MDWKLHLIFACFLIIGWLSGLTFVDLIQLSPLTIFLLSGIIILSSLFPDVDMVRSKTREMLALIFSFILALIYLIFFKNWFNGLLLFLIFYFIFRYSPTKHRGLTHTFKFSFFFSFCVTTLIYLLFKISLKEFITWFLISLSSYTLHLTCDRVGKKQRRRKS